MNKRRCCKCGIERTDASSLRFHQFPRVNDKSLFRVRAWANYCFPDHDWSSVDSLRKLRNNKMVCEMHFDKSCYDTKGNLLQFSMPGCHQMQPDLDTTIKQTVISTDTVDDGASHDVVLSAVYGSTDQAVSDIGILKEQNSIRSDLSENMSGCHLMQPDLDTTIKQTVISTDTVDDGASHDVVLSAVYGSTDQAVSDIGILKEQNSIRFALSENRASQNIVLSTVYGSSDSYCPVAVPKILNEQNLITMSEDKVSHDVVVSTEEGSKEQNAEQSRISTTSKINKIRKRPGWILEKLGLTKKNKLTQREQLIYRQLRLALNKVSRLRAELKHKNNILKKLMEDNNLQNLHTKKNNGSRAFLLQSQLKNCKRPRKGARWCNEDKIIALSIYEKSPACYKLISQLCRLPSTATLRNLLNRTPVRRSMNKHMLS